MFKTSFEGFLVNVDTGKVVWKNSAEKAIWLGLLGGQLDRLFGGAGSIPCAQYRITLEDLLRTFPKMSKGSAP